MVEDAELDATYGKMMHEIRNTLAARSLLGAPDRKQEDLLHHLLALATDQVKLLSGVYSELVEARHDRRKTPKD